jgi:CopA family copper-resistance protein
MKYFLFLSFTIFFFTSLSAQTTANNHGHTTEYDLYVSDTTVNYTGKNRHAISINGQISGPTIELTEGDTAILRVHNMMAVTTSIHWHGIIIPNRFDGVPGLNNYPIEPGKTFEVIFPVKQSGTYWYHSHTMTQEQIGLTGSIVIHKIEEPKMKEEVLVLNDWTNTNPAEVWRLLKRGTDWYGIKKNSVQSYGEALAAGHLGDKLKQEWKRMPAMDISDVKYTTFLTNGMTNFSREQYKAGDKLKLRIINASSSSYFWLQFAGGKMQVVAADGQDVQPVEVDKFLIATAETYDVVIEIPAAGKYELRATAQDIQGYTSAFFGLGNVVAAPTIPRVEYFKIMAQMNKMMQGMNMMMGKSKPMTNKEMPDGNMQMPMKKDKMDMGKMDSMGDMKNHNMQKMPGHDMKNMDMKGMDMKSMGGMKMGKMKMYGFDFPPGNGDDKVLDYNMLKAMNNSGVAVPKGKPDRVIELAASGNMFRYVWTFNNNTLTNADKILIKKGEHVRVILKNNTMMEHPLHLHGHFFRLLNGTTLNDAPLKHTFNLMPMATDTLDFAADEEKDWFFHCHTLYHMLSGMAREFHYDNTLPEVQKESPVEYRKFKKEHGRKTFLWGSAAFQSQGNFTNATIAGTKWEVNEEFAWDWKKKYESETMFRRFIDKRQFFSVFVGADNRREGTGEIKNGEELLEYKNRATAGITYFLPLFIMAEGRVDHKGKFRLQLGRQDLELTKRARFSFVVNTDKEYMAGLKYVLSRNLALSGGYDSDYGWGAGLSLVY